MGSLGPGPHKVLFEPSKHLWQVWGFDSKHNFWGAPKRLISCCQKQHSKKSLEGETKSGLVLDHSQQNPFT